MTVTCPPKSRRPASAGPSTDGPPRFRPPFPIVQAKLGPPRPKPGTIDRGRLVRLLSADRASVVCVVAPPGYGKTTLLAQWFASERRPRAWLTLDDLDSDPAILVTYLAAAFDAVEPIDGPIPVNSGSVRRIRASAVPRLVAGLHRWRQPGVLVLDNVHVLADRRSLDVLAALLGHLPPGFRVAIAGRTEPDLPIGRIRAQRDLLEIGPGILALDEDETTSLTAAVGCSLAPDDIRELRARTEGWAAGTYLATLALRRSARRPDAVRDLSGDDRYIASYLRTEFEHDLDDEDVTLLTRTAILDTIKPATAEAVSGMPGAGDRLRTLAHDSLFIQELGPPGTSYRYHNLVRDYLKAELNRREPGATPELHRRAAAWYAGAGGIDRAVEHATATGDVDIAASFATAPAVPVFYRGHVATVDRWLARYELADFERHPPLAILGAWVNILSGRPDAAERMADIVDRTALEQPSVDRSGRFESQRAMLRAVMGRNGPRDVLANARVAMARGRSDGPWRAGALWSLASAYLLLGDLPAADATFADAVIAGGPSAGATTMIALAERASIRIRRAEWDAADAFIQESRAMLLEQHYEEIVSSLIVHALGARLAIHRGDLDKGREELARAELARPLANHAIPWFSVDALLELARAHLANSEPADAEIVLRDAEQIVRRRPALGILTDEFIELRRRVAGAASTLVGSSSLTTAELRVLALLPTYLSLQEIAGRLTISRNTVKTHAMSIYGKLWASSRGEAVERAVMLGLLEPTAVLAPSAGDGRTAQAIEPWTRHA